MKPPLFSGTFAGLVQLPSCTKSPSLPLVRLTNLLAQDSVRLQVFMSQLLQICVIEQEQKKSGSCMVCVQQCCCGIYIWQIVSAVHAHCEWQNGGCQYVLHVRHHNHRAAKNRGTVFIALPQKLCGVITAHLLRLGVLPGLAVMLLPYLAE